MKFRTFIEQYDEKKENAIKDIWKKTLGVFLGDVTNPERVKEALNDSLSDMKGGKEVLTKLQGVFSDMNSIPDLRDNAIEAKNWLSKSKPSADYTLGGLLRHMFGEEMMSRLVAGKDAVDSATAKVEQQPPVENPAGPESGNVDTATQLPTNPEEEPPAPPPNMMPPQTPGAALPNFPQQQQPPQMPMGGIY